MRTDGLVAVVTLQTCKPSGPLLDSSSAASNYRPGNHVFRFMRRQILTFKNDIFRANIIYAVYDGGRMTWSALHRQPQAAEASYTYK
jgi:hypothetical protein